MGWSRRTRSTTRKSSVPNATTRSWPISSRNRRNSGSATSPCRVTQTQWASVRAKSGTRLPCRMHSR